MCNLEELKKCRIVKYVNHYYVVNYNGSKWLNLHDGSLTLVDDSHYKRIGVAYKNWVDFRNDIPFYTRCDDLLSVKTKEWLKYIVRSLKNVNQDTFILKVFENYCTIGFKTNDDALDNISLANYENIIYDFTKLEKGKIYTFKELGIKL